MTGVVIVLGLVAVSQGALIMSLINSVGDLRRRVSELERPRR